MDGPGPLLFSGGQTNLYSYAANDPLNQRDNSGLGGIPSAWIQAAYDYASKWVQDKIASNMCVGSV